MCVCVSVGAFPISFNFQMKLRRKKIRKPYKCPHKELSLQSPQIFMRYFKIPHQPVVLSLVSVSCDQLLYLKINADHRWLYALLSCNEVTYVW